jgi:hypothetical protein
MSLRQLHNSISTIYHFIFNDPKLYNLIDKIDNLSIDKLAKILSYYNIQNLNYDKIIEKLYSVENKSQIDFCNVIDDILIHNILYINDNLSNEILLCCRDFFNNIYKYYIIGFFFESYIDKYNKIINKIKLINEESKSVEKPDYLLIKNKKDELYKLLLKDFLLELYTKFIFNIVKLYKTPIDINSNNNPTKIFEEITNNFVNLIDLYNLHNNNIEKLTSV